MSDLNDFTQDLISMATTLQNGKHAKQFMRKEATKLRRETVKEAKKSVDKKSGSLFKAIKKGKAVKKRNAVLVNVYGSKEIAPHLLWANNGHIIKGKDGTEHGFKEGEHFLEKAEDNFKQEFFDDVDNWIDDMLDNHGL